MIGSRKTLAVSIATPGGDNPLLLDLLQANPIYRGIAVSGIALVAKGGTAPYAYSILATSFNDLPGGLSVDALTGQITGTPTTAGHFTFIAEVQDGASNVFAHSFSIDVLAQLFFVGPPPPIGERTIAYSYRFRVEDASGTLLTSGFTSTGTLPAGLSLSGGGVLSGTPTTPLGTSYFTVHATDGTDTLDIQVALEIVQKLTGFFIEDIGPPNGWGGGPNTFLPSMVRQQKWEATLVIVDGVPPYSVEISSINPYPSGITYNHSTRKLTGITTDASSPYPAIHTLLITDALGSQNNVQRFFFIIDSIQGRVRLQLNGVDVDGGIDGAVIWNFQDGVGSSFAISSDGGTANIQASTTGVGGSLTINGVSPDSGGNWQVDGLSVDSNGDLVIHAVTSLNISGGSTGLTFSGGPITTSGTITAGGTLSIGSGGTGQSTASAAYTALSPETTKGDLTIFTTLPARFSVGANGTIMYADSTQTSGWSKGAPGGDLTGSYPAPTLVATAVTPGSYGDATHVATFTVDSKGRLTLAGSVSIGSGSSAVAPFAYGDGSDGAFLADGIATYPFATLAGSVYTLTRDVCCTTFQATNGCSVNPRAFKLWGSTGALDCSAGANPVIVLEGGAGSNAVGLTGGNGGSIAVSSAGTLAVPGGAGLGATGGAGAGAVGSAGAHNAQTAENGGAGGAGGAGGNGPVNLGGASQGGVSPTTFPIGYPKADLFVPTAANVPTFKFPGGGIGGSGGSGGGGNGGGVNSGGGGGGGAAGGVADIRFRDVFKGTYTLVGLRGARGGNGGNAPGTNAGGGGAGGGGGGGWLIFMFSTTSGSGTCKLDASGGAGGTGGAKAGTGFDGSGGTGGAGGRMQVFNTTSGTPVFQNGPAGSAPTGTTGGAGGSNQYTLP